MNIQKMTNLPDCEIIIIVLLKTKLTTIPTITISHVNLLL